MKSFEIPSFYRSPLISAIKEKRKADDKLKKDFTPLSQSNLTFINSTLLTFHFLTDTER